MKNQDSNDEQARELVDELGGRLHDEIGSFLSGHPEVPSALVGLPG